ncbi:CDP-diacylglycerol--serine O-phosphatidyltransferase [Candidatus Woesearchaeota archaeon]|nr:CDP-diacylglycerol--serine O-phosphatidyltransferase [Candidatus Woesearchaeota archaeon]
MNIKENFSIFRMIEFPHVLTLLNLICGMISILFAVAKQYRLAAVFMIVAVFFDFIDGRMARYMKKVTPMGKELDSLSDIVSFGAAPVVLAYQTTTNIGEGWIFAAIIYMVFLAAGALRLARFNVKEATYFEGMPITVNGIVVPLFYFLGLTSWYPFIFLVSAIFMISAFRIKKFI